jgi:MFS family permease
LVWGVGTVLGPVVGGAFEKVTWRWAFYINLIIGGIWAPIYFLLLPSFDPRAGTPISKRTANFDYLGAVLSVAGFICIIMAISFGGALYPWNSGSIIALFVVGGVVWIAFFLTQSFSLFTTDRDRMFPLHFLKNKEAILLFLLMGTGAAAAFIPIYYIPLYFQFTQNDNALESAVRLLPFICVLSAFILMNGALMSKFGYYKPWYLVGSALGLIGSALMCKFLLANPLHSRPSFSFHADNYSSANQFRHQHSSDLRL